MLSDASESAWVAVGQASGGRRAGCQPAAGSLPASGTVCRQAAADRAACPTELCFRAPPRLRGDLASSRRSKESVLAFGISKRLECVRTRGEFDFVVRYRLALRIFQHTG